MDETIDNSTAKPQRVINVGRHIRRNLFACEIICGDVVKQVNMTDYEIEMEKLRDKLIASGASPDLVDEFQTVVSNYCWDERE
jgi:hypothetical protein